MPDRIRSDERSLSDVLGYVLVFSLVVTSVLLVTVGGLATVEDARDSEQAQNAERSFQVVADNFASIYERNAPSRSTEISLGESEIFYNSNSSLTVRGDDQELASRDLRPVQMDVTGEQSVAYEAGAVFRDNGQSIAMVRPPPFLLSESRVHLPVIQTSASSIESAGGATVLLRGISTGRLVATSGNETELGFDELTIEISSPRFRAWERYFSDEQNLDCTTDPDVETVTCTLDLGSQYLVHVTIQQIEISLVL
jgi:hypothetical protein